MTTTKPERLGPKLLSWASSLAENTRDQALTASTLDYIHPHIALMPDAHLGKGATVGSVIPTVGAIIPAAVGVDIGCGMDAVLTPLTLADVERIGRLRVLRTSIEREIPLSAGHDNKAVRDSRTQERIDRLRAMADEAGFDPAEYAKRWHLQLGSLGSGNHFIEVSLDEQDRVWLFLHSGSRGVGNRIAQRHIKVAQRVCERDGTRPPEPDLAHLTEGTPEFDHYLRELRWAQELARLNRAEMMDRVVDCVARWAGTDVERLEEVSCHHNYTEREEHDGQQVWLSRKGAIDAHAGVPGLIPGSMGTRSYVVVGKGSAQALHSAPHGAGRKMSRNAARRRFTREELREAMTGIEYRDTDAFIDEIPGAYKDIDQVMADAADLVEIRHELRQIVNVKGD